MKFKAITLAVTMMLTQTSFAASNQPTCPELSTLKSVGLEAARMTRLRWIGHTTQAFGTESNWTFFTFIVGQFDTAQEALVKGNADLVKLSNVEGPMNSGRSPNQWICTYSGTGADAFTITPAVTSNGLLSMMSNK